MSGGEHDEEAAHAGSAMPSLAEIACILRKRWPIIALCPLLAVLGAMMVAMLIPAQFEATATVYIDARQKKIVDFDPITPDLKGDNMTIDSEAQVLQSSTLVARVVDRLQLAEDSEFAKPERLRNRILGWVGLHPRDPVAAVPRPGTIDDLISNGSSPGVAPSPIVEAVASRLAVHRRGFTYLIEITFRSRNPEKAARIANAIPEAYLQDQVEAKMHAAELVTFWLDKRISELKERVYSAERLVEKYKAEHNLVDSEGHPLDEKELARDMEQLVEARASTAKAKAKYDQAMAFSDSDMAKAANADVLESPTISGLRGALAKAHAEQAELRTRYGAKHPAMLQADANVRSAETQIREEINRIIANLRNEYEVASGREAAMEGSLDSLKANAATSNQAVVKLHELEREANASRGVYEAFLKRAEETAQQQNLQLPDARIVERAVPPDSPSSPQRAKIMAAGAGGGLALGLVIAVLLELLFPSVVRSGQIENSLRLRHLTSVPTAPGGDRLGALRRILIAPGSLFSEAIRGIRIALEAARSEQRSRVIVLASALPGEGRTVIASNLAHHYTLTGTKTLLVDCDMRMAGLTRKLLPAASLGLMDCLLNGIPVQQAIGVDAVTGIHFLPARAADTRSSAFAELLASPAMADVMLALKREFDIIVCDCPPILPVVDARIIADFADQIVYVLRWRKTPRALAQQALKSLDANLHKVTGVVVNGVSESQLAQSSGLAMAGGYLKPVSRAA